MAAHSPDHSDLSGPDFVSALSGSACPINTSLGAEVGTFFWLLSCNIKFTGLVDRVVVADQSQTMKYSALNLTCGEIGALVCTVT